MTIGHTTLLSLMLTLWAGRTFGSLWQQPITDARDRSEIPYSIRSATVEDAYDIARIIVDAFASVPYWQYYYQFKDEYADYHLECKRRQVARIISDRSLDYDNVINVIDAPIETTDGRVVMKPASVAMWEVVRKRSVLPKMTTYDCFKFLDVNITRAVNFTSQLLVAEYPYTYSEYGDLLYLAVLTTHPEWQGHGLAPAHCQWGQAYARAKEINITLLATPPGYPVYRDLGFESIDNITITKIDRDGTFWFEGMKWTSKEIGPQTEPADASAATPNLPDG